ncbi:MAG: YceI family protein [Anaerolineae bacterium]|nr:YceI family protein [Anaerolineae bacterium]
MIKKIVIVMAVILIIAVGIIVYLFLKPPEQASGPIEAIPLPAASTPTIAQINPAAETIAPTTEPELETETGPETEPEAESGPEAAAPTATVVLMEETAIETEPAPSDETAPIIFEIVPAESEARFYIDEVLRGDPITVMGVTNQVAGQFALAPANLAATQMGAIQVNARTLATDNQFRNRAIKNRILLTDDYEFITFRPTELNGLPASGAVGETYTFQVTGELSITDVTRPTTFEVTATAVSESRIQATATTDFLYTDFDLFIPDVPAVDTVDDQVRLEIEFVAEAIE